MVRYDMGSTVVCEEITLIQFIGEMEANRA